MVRLLLLSDIHFLSLAKEMDQHSYVRDCFITDLKDYVAQYGSINHILVSGDIASKGDSCEYDSAFDFFDLVSKAAGCNMENIYIIPGNHDKNFSAERSQLRHIVNAGLSYTSNKENTPDLFYELITSDADALRMLYTPFQEYYKLALKMDSYESLMQQCLDNKDFNYNPKNHQAYYKKELGCIDNYKIYLYGMNSCLNCDWYDENDFGKGHKMFLPKLTYNIPVETEGCINISMMHHPLDKILNGESIAKIFDKKFHIQIFGHLHRPVSDGKTTVHIQSGALQPPIDENDKSEAYFSTYNIVELYISPETKDVLHVKLRVEKFNKIEECFEELDSECHDFNVPLKKHNSRWEKQYVKNKKQVEIFPDNVSIRQIRLSFLQYPTRRNLIQELDEYDENKSLNENCILFLKKMEDKGKLVELWNKLNR